MMAGLLTQFQRQRSAALLSCHDRYLPAAQHKGIISLRTGLIVLLALVISSTVRAQSDPAKIDIDTPGLTIEAIAGWDGTVGRSKPIPLSFLLSNNTERLIEGHLKLHDPIYGREVTLGEVVISPGATRRFTSIQAMTDWFQCFATLTAGEKILWRRELALATGKEFDSNLNFALFIDDSGRNLQLPGALSDTAAISYTDSTVAPKQGRQFRCLTVKPWQVPNHPGPLVVAQAIIFPEGATEAQLNGVQWRAVAEWMCQGGAIFIHNESLEIIERLTDSAPLNAEAPIQSGDFLVRQVGLGSIQEYSQPLFSSQSGQTRQLLAEKIASLSSFSLRTFMNSAILQPVWGRTELNRTLVISFFLFYTFFSGVVTLLLFRQSQRRIATYTIIVVATVSVLSCLIGGFLRFSKGDLSWITVTQPGAGGVMQVGTIEVQSAGGRDSLVVVTGEETDLQLLERPRYGYYSWNRQIDDAPFTWQPNLAANEEGTYSLKAPLTPWGRRRLQATAFRREFPRLEFELAFERRYPQQDETAAQARSSGAPLGEFSLQVSNPLPFDITSCWLVIGGTQSYLQQTTSPPGGLQSQNPWSQTVASTPSGLIDVYQMKKLPILETGTTYNETFQANFKIKNSDWGMRETWPGGSLTFPRISRLGSASAWIVGRIENSPIMNIDEQRSDFVPQTQLHLYLQEIHPEDMPDASLFLGSEESATDASIEPGTR